MLPGKLWVVSARPTDSDAPQGLRTDDGVAAPLTGSYAIPTSESRCAPAGFRMSAPRPKGSPSFFAESSHSMD